MSTRTLVVGSLAYDVLLGCDGRFRDALPDQADQPVSAIYLAPHYARHHGGTGVNIAWHLRLLSADPLLVSTVGSDGGPFRELLRERGIDTTYVEQMERAVTATAIIGTDTQQEQLGYFHPGADTLGTWPDLQDRREEIGYAIISPREERVMISAIEWCRTMSVPFFFDPGQRLTSFAADDLRRSLAGAAGLIVNEFEWNLLQKRLQCSEQDVLTETPLVVLTRGSEGVALLRVDGRLDLPACQADQVINPTGAGDAFRSGLLTGLQAGWEIEDAAKLGAAVASFVVEIEGTLLDTLDTDILRNRAEQAYGEPLADWAT